MPVLEVLRLLCGLLACIAAGAPLAALGVLQPLMREAGVYSDKCHVHILDAQFGLCADAEFAYRQLFTVSLAACGVAVLPAWLSVRKNGFTVPTLCCALLLAAGSAILSDSNNILDQYFDKYLIGFPLLACAAPFAILNTVASLLRLRAPAPVWALVFVCSRLQPLLFAFMHKLSASFDDLMLNFVYVPILVFFFALLLMPLADGNDDFDVPDSVVPCQLNTTIFHFLATWAAVNAMLLDMQLFEGVEHDFVFGGSVLDRALTLDWRAVILAQLVVVFVALNVSLRAAAIAFSLASAYAVHIAKFYPAYTAFHAVLVFPLLLRFVHPLKVPYAYLALFLVTAILEQLLLTYTHAISLALLQKAQLLVAAGFLYFPRRALQSQQRIRLEIEAEAAPV